jgi:hypothetical protein
MLLTRRQARALMAAGAGAATYLAASEIGAKKIRVGSLFLLASAGMAGLAATAATSRASAKAIAVENRLTNLINNGGSFGGDIHVVGNHYVTGSQTVSGSLSSGSHTVNGNMNLTGNNISNVNQMDGGGSATNFTPGMQVSSGALDTTGIINGGSSINAAGRVTGNNTSGDPALSGESSGWENGAQIRINDFISALG